MESLRRTGAIDMKAENELLKAQLDQHKRFVTSFKHLCDNSSHEISLPDEELALPTDDQRQKEEGYSFASVSIKKNEMEQPVSQSSQSSSTVYRRQPRTSHQGKFKHISHNARHAIYRQGADAAHEHVLALLSQSVADHWLEAVVPEHADIPYDDFHVFYKFQTEFGAEQLETIKRESDQAVKKRKARQRLNVRLDITYEGLSAEVASEFLWSTLCNTSEQQRLHNVKNIEVVQHADDAPDKETKLFYYREKYAPPLKDRDWVIIYNQRPRDISSLLLSPQEVMKNRIDARKLKKLKSPLRKSVSCQVLSLSTTKHSNTSVLSEFNQITSLFIQGTVIFNDKANARLIVLFSFPDDFQIKAVKNFADIIHPEGTLGLKFIEVIKELYDMLGEHQ